MIFKIKINSIYNNKAKMENNNDAASSNNFTTISFIDTEEKK